MGFLTLAWALAGAGLGFAPPLWLKGIGGGLVALGVALMIAAVFAMWRHHTTVIPHRVPSDIVTDGIYRFTRNPIYLGDVFTLLGFSLLYGSPAGVLLIPVFMAVIQRRFIAEEEKWLGTKFASEFQSWAERTRRWL
ncbi:methyltransferase family protein [Celeribacter neptunius]|uniref:methyltransferase family protein n=1 Tax=Celeribacter neptunius TaxID=588602 RepID=UPI0015A59E5B|nr:isoprenylcysteine carboxylmethyltransferase family protein [Celeribacter neptunius]